jgi:hypothetical protein
MDISEKLLKTIQTTQRCMVDVRALAGKLDEVDSEALSVDRQIFIA